MANRTKGIIAAAVVIVLLLGVGTWYFYLRDDAPEEVSLEAATALGISASTADNDWFYAKSWLRVEMSDSDDT